MPFFKIHRSHARLVLAACDESMIGKSFSLDGTSISISPGFYGKEKCSIDELKKLMLDADIINLMGKECVEAAVVMGLADPSNTLHVSGGMVHAQIVRE